MTEPYILYSMQESGNCYKVRLLLRLLDLPFRLVETDPRTGVTRSPDFLALNPNGRVPLLVRPDGQKLSESNAILLHLAEGTRFLPADTYDRAVCYQWLFFEQYEHEPTIAVARSVLHIYPDRRGKATAEQIADWQTKGHRALAVMEKRLAGNDWLASTAYSVADIALYAYTHVAGEGGFNLDPYPGIRAWLDRIAAGPGHVGIDWRPAT
jgi:glutathione S-transferase